MMRLLRYLLAIVAGFALALYFQWTLSLNLSNDRAVYEYRTDPTDGLLIRLPIVVEEFNISLTAQPYRPAATFDLFDPAPAAEGGAE